VHFDNFIIEALNAMKVVSIRYSAIQSTAEMSKWVQTKLIASFLGLTTEFELSSAMIIINLIRSSDVIHGNVT